MFEVGEHERGPRDLADLARADGDVLKGAPAPDEQGEAALGQAAQGPQQGVASALLMSSSVPSAGCLTGVSTPWPALS